MPPRSAPEKDTHPLDRASALELSCLGALALLGEPANRSALARWVKTLDVRHPAQAGRQPGSGGRTGRQVSTADLATMLERWETARLAIPTGASGGTSHFVHPAAADDVLSHPRSRGLLQSAFRELQLEEARQQRRHYDPDAHHRRLTLARAALYLDMPDQVESYFEAAREAAGRKYGRDAPRSDLLHPQAPHEAIRRLPTRLREAFTRELLERALQVPFLPHPSVLSAVLSDPAPEQASARAHAAMLVALGPGGKPPADALGQDDSSLATQARALWALREARWNDARELAVHAFERGRGSSRRRKARLEGPLAPLLTLVLATGNAEQRAIARTQLKRAEGSRGELERFIAARCLLEGEHPSARLVYSHYSDLCTFELLLAAAFLGASDTRTEPQFRAAAARQSKALVESFDATGLVWLAQQATGLERHFTDAEAEPGAAGVGLLLELQRPKPVWERALERLEVAALEDVADVQALEASTPASDERLVFLVSLSEVRSAPHFGGDDADLDPDAFRDGLDEDDFWDDELDGPYEPHADDDVQDGAPRLHYRISVEPRLQKRRGNGWTAGRTVALRRLAEQTDTIDCLGDDDRRVCLCIDGHRDWNGVHHSIGARATLALVGHPRVFWADDPNGPPVTVVQGSPTLVVHSDAAGLRLRAQPAPDGAGLVAHKDGQGRLSVCRLSRGQRAIVNLLEQMPPIPRDGEARLMTVLAKLVDQFVVHSHAGVDTAMTSIETIETIEADPRPAVQLSRATPGILVHVAVQPAGPEGPSFVPGEGPDQVTARIDGRRQQCVRDRAAERRALEQAAASAPELQCATEAPLHVDDMEACLSLLQRLSALGEAVRVWWPQGEPLSVDAELDLPDLRLSLTDEGHWLGIAGEAQLQEGLVLSMAELLRGRSPGSRFVALGDGRHVALSGELQRQLDAIRAAALPDRKKSGDELRLPPAALGFVSPWLRELRQAARLSLDGRAKKRLAAVEAAYATQPRVPSTFEGELRPYQSVGFRFLVQLGAFGAGGILADDMGLGKTPMTLALLLARGQDGPALVVAPLSVKGNWQREAQRFAPTLRVRTLGAGAAVDFAALQPFDVIVCSYAVMVNQIEALERVQWATVVLDEAQAIKNAATQRAKMASRLVSGARFALTGTPIENHLGDLHSLMSFLNPGLLGSARQFAERFAKPIQRDGDAQASKTLRTLIAPFILRRRKAEVLQELPGRTEIVVEVEPSDEERAFVEALRRDAVARLKQAGSTGSAVSILAEITRLRRAACHPQLVVAHADVGAAKLERCVELVLELRDGGHRALIFSQFVGFLALVRTALEQAGVTYRYLDGSTPEARRNQAVAEFQAGHSDVFLISLKAGGFGLNLTAADYVIHLDPWWNPAVEAQASDRAHRIGQQRPVTIYKLVNAGSIEERVLALHGRKRELAEELLRDAAQATRLDADALMSLLSE